MIRRLNRLLAIIAIAAAVAYLLTVNPQPATLTLSRAQVFHASMGVMVLAIFGSGVVLASLIGGAIGIRSYFRERSLRAKLAQREALVDMILRARSFMVAREFPRAKSLLSSVIRRDGANLPARLELARCLELEGDLPSALGVLEEARAENNEGNIELLVRSAELHRAVGNRTAALELIVRAQEREGSRFLLERARDLARESGDLESALRYHREWVDLSSEPEEARKITAELEFARLAKEWDRQPTPPTPRNATWRDTLRAFLKRFPECVPALVACSREEIFQGDTAEAVAHLSRAAQLSGDPGYWYEASELWLSSGQPERAVAVARTASKDSEGSLRLYAEFELARVLLSLSMTDEAERTLGGLEELASREQVPWTGALTLRSWLLRALLFLQRRQLREAQRAIDELLRQGLTRAAEGGSAMANRRAIAVATTTPLLDAPAKTLPSPDGVAPALSTP